MRTLEAENALLCRAVDTLIRNRDRVHGLPVEPLGLVVDCDVQAVVSDYPVCGAKPEVADLVFGNASELVTLHCLEGTPAPRFVYGIW